MPIPPSARWDELKPHLARLYMHEQRSLRDTMALMQEQHGFTATERSFKRHIRAWGWRKNIAVAHDGADALAVQWAATGQVQGQVQLANGLVVDAARLARHVRRREWGERHKMMMKKQQEECGLLPRLHGNVALPDDYRTYQIIFVQSQEYMYKSHPNMTSIGGAVQAVTNDIGPLIKWHGFASKVSEALANNDLDAGLYQMRSAPAQVFELVTKPPASVLFNLFLFILNICFFQDRENNNINNNNINNNNNTCEQQQQQQQQQQQRRDFLSLVTALIRYAATVQQQNLQQVGGGSHHKHDPLAQVLGQLARVSEANLREVAFRAWTVTCQAWANMAQLPSITHSQKTPIRVVGPWLDRLNQSGSKSDVLSMTRDIEECVKACDTDNDRKHATTILALQSKSGLLSFLLRLQSMETCRDPALAGSGEYSWLSELF